MRRWWRYQRERFPLLAHGPLVGVVSAGTLGFSALARGGEFPGLAQLGVGFLTTLLFFFQLRVADEFKDFQEDARHRPERAVPRGLVSLRELVWLFGAGVVVQAGLNLWLSWSLFSFLALVWAYMGLMRVEFFAPRWLKAHPGAYLLSHMLVMPLIYLYLSACDWVVAGAAPPAALLGWLGAAFCSGLVVELGRKLKAPEQERPGVQTYTVVWGTRPATAAWFGALAVSGALAGGAAWPLGWAWALVGLTLAGALWGAWAFAQQPTPQRAKALEALSALWVLVLHAAVGMLPWWGGRA